MRWDLPNSAGVEDRRKGRGVSNYPPGGHYYDEAEVDFVNELLDRGFPVKKIADLLVEFWGPDERRTQRPFDWHRTLSNRVRVIASDRWNWCTRQDPLNIEAAFAGSQRAWEQLNYYERRTVVLRLQELLDTNQRHPQFCDLPIHEGGLAQWAESVGNINTQIITNALGRLTRMRGVSAETKSCVDA